MKTSSLINSLSVLSIKPDKDILSVGFWKNTKTFNSIKNKETQLNYYLKMNSCEEVIKLVSLDSKTFGSEIEKIIREIFQISDRTSSQNDGTRNDKKIEIKSARFWGGKDECVWQHIEIDYDYDVILLVLLDFTKFKVWGITKNKLINECIVNKVLTKQGKQGHWTKKSSLLPYLTDIRTIKELDKFLDF